MPTETVQQKAARYLDEGRVTTGRNCYVVRGETGTYTVTQRPDKSLRCSCPVRAKQQCSHRAAVELYRAQRREDDAVGDMAELMDDNAEYAEMLDAFDAPAPEEVKQVNIEEKKTMGQFVIQKAVKAKKKARIALDGPAGSGKTYTALELAEGLADGGKIGLLDTEKSSADLYADRYEFDTIKLSNFSPNNYIGAIEAFAEAGYEVLIIDSWSHAWDGEGGALEMVDEAAKRNKGNSYVGWRDVTPIHNRMIGAILDFPGHVIVTMRSKMEYALEKDEKTGKTSPRKIGMAPIQRSGVEYEFDVVVDMDLDHNFIVSKTRLSCLDGKVIRNPTRKVGKGILDDLNSGAVAAPAPAPKPVPATVPEAATETQAPPPAEPEQAEAPVPAATSAYQIPPKRRAAMAAALTDIGLEQEKIEALFAKVTDKELDKKMGTHVAGLVEKWQQAQVAQPEAPAAAPEAPVSAPEAQSGATLPIAAETAPQAAGDDVPDPFGPEAETMGSAAPLTDSEEAQYDQTGQPANAAGEAHSAAIDEATKAREQAIEACEQMAAAFLDGDVNAVPEKYHEVVDDGASGLTGFLNEEMGWKASERASFKDSLGFTNVKFAEMTVGQLLYVAMATENEKK